MCGRVIQSSGPLRLAIVEGLNAPDSRFSRLKPRYNGAPSQELLVIREHHATGQRSLDLLRWGLIPHWCDDPAGGRKPINAKAETVASLPTFRDAYARRRRKASALMRLPCGTARLSRSADYGRTGSLPSLANGCAPSASLRLQPT